MKTMQKRVISLFLSMLMIVSIIPIGTISSSAAGGVKSKLDAVIASYPSGSRWTSSFDGGIQCYGFAKMVTHKIFGTYNGKYRSWTYAGVSTSGMNVVGSITNYSYDNVKNLLSKAKCGDVLQFNSTKQHSMIVYSVDSSGVTIYDCNWDNNCGISKRHSSFGAWSGRNSSKLTLLRADNYSSVDGSSVTHTHSYSGSNFEAAHPHKVYQKCSCGATKYTGATRAYHNCSTCMKVSSAYVKPVKAYTINTGKTTVYNAVNGTAKSNKIYDTDLCTISQIYDCGWCKVTFPLDAGGTDTGYCKISTFMKSSGFIAYTSKQITTYRRSDLSTSSGYAGAGDKIYVLGNTSSAIQIAYPLTAGGYKVGWVPISSITYTIKYNANGGSGSMSSSSLKYQSTITLTANKYTKTGYTFGGWNAYRSSDKTWYVSGQGWKTASEISSKGYTKKVYSNKTKFTLEKSWISPAKTNDTLTFYAVWKPNTLSVSYNANGGTLSSDTYKLSNNIVYKKSDSNKYVQKWTYNSAKTNGLVNASTFGLTREGYNFKGWGTSSSGGTIFDQNDTALVPSKINTNIKSGNCSTTLYAIWTPKTYSVKFDANGGIGAPANQTKTYGKSLTLSNTIPTKDGFKFLGWSTSQTATSATYQPGASYTANSSITLYAVWQAVSTTPTHTHEWNTDYTIDKEATCTETGSKSIHCKTCGEQKDAVSIPVIQHSYKIVIIKEASCSEKGETVKRCLMCGAETEKAEIPMTEHSFVSTVTTEATCSHEGIKEDICSECNLHTNKESIPMIEHEFSEWTTEKEATSSENGIESRKCKNCDYTEKRNVEYIPVYDENAPRVLTTSANAKAGDEVEVQIKLENNPGITALRLIIGFDENALEMTDFCFSDALSSMNKGTSEKYGSNYSVSMYSATADLNDCGTIATIKFKVKEEAADGEYPITITYDPDDIFNLAGDCVNFDIEVGAVTVNSYLSGDVNDDGKINMRDVVLLQQVVNGWNVIYNKNSADYNNDGKINMRDIVALQQYING